MGKVRVHELAKKLNMSNQELIAKLSAKGIIVRTHSSTIDEAQAMVALGLGDGSDAQAQGRPRTVLRRRRAEDAHEEIEPPLKEASKVETVMAPEPEEPKIFPTVLEQPPVSPVSEQKTHVEEQPPTAVEAQSVKESARAQPAAT